MSRFYTRAASRILQTISFIVLSFSLFQVNAQNAVVGQGFSSGWGGGSCPTGNGNFTYLSANANSTFGGILTPNGTGNQFFRFGIDWGGTTAQRTLTIGSDVSITSGTAYTLNSNCTTSGAMFMNVGNTSERYVFKTTNAGTNPTGRFVVFRLGSAPVTVSSVTRAPSGTVVAGENTVVTATLSGAFPTGQGVYLRYTKDGYATSTIVAMTGSGTSYSATVPGSFNTAGANVSYYVFTSGAGLTIPHADADLFTINLNNNSGSNFTYTVNTPGVIYLHPFSASSKSHPFTDAPSTFATNLSNSSWTNSVSAWASFGGVTGQSIVIQPANNTTSTMTLTFSVAAGYKVSISSFSFWARRTTGGPVINSISINGVTVTSGTITPSTNTTGVGGAAVGPLNVANTVENLTGTVTLVFNLGTTSGTSQNLRIDDFTLRGTVSVSPQAPTLTTPTVASITHESALLGANITSDGNIALTARGTSYKTSSPVVATDNQLAEGLTATGVFTQTRTGLQPQTEYFFVGYATNGIGTSISSEGSFRTLSNPPATQASGLTATGVSAFAIDLGWTGATFPGTGATNKGYILLRATSPNTPSLASVNGEAPAAGANTTIVSSAIAEGATTFSNTGLAPTTTYNYLLVPYTWDGTNNSTYNYLTASAPTASGSTQAGAIPPTVSSNAATAITSVAATLNGNVTDDGGGTVTARGFVYSTSDNTPTIGESGVTDQAAGSGTGVFDATVSLSANTTYYFQAYATNSAGTSYGGVQSFTTLKAEPTTQPTDLVFSSVTDASFSTAFTAASGTPDGYIVVRSTSATLSGNPVDGTTYNVSDALGGGTVISVGTTVSGIASSGLSANTEYYVFVFAYNNSGAGIDYLTSSPLTASVLTRTATPAAPSFGSITTTDATISWSPVTGATSYQLDVSTSSTFTSYLSGYENLSLAGTSEVLSALTPNTVYYARVRAVNAGGASANSANGTGTTLHNAPGIAAGSNATASAIRANWTAPTGGGAATFTYTVELSTNELDFSTPVATQSNIASGTLFFIFSGLNSGTEYFYRVRAVNATGASAWSNVSAGYSTLANTLSIDVLGTPITENFNAMGSSATATIPTGIRIGTTYTSATSATTVAYGTTGTNAVTGSSGAGVVNWANGVTASSTDRALGFLNSGSFTSPRSIIAAFRNNTGSTITDVQIDWNYEKYRSGSRAFNWTFFHGATATPATAATDGDQAYAADANNTTVFNPPTGIAKSVALNGLSIAPGATYYLLWTFTGVGGSTNGQGIGIDDISIKACGTVAAPTAADQAFCSATSPTIASLAATGANIQWFTDATGGTALAGTTALSTATTYYASQTIDGCTSQTRTAVLVTINNNPAAPTGAATQDFCSSAAPTVASLSATGSSIQWYADATGGTALATSTALVNNTTYYATQTVTACESETRFAVLARLNASGTWIGSVDGDWTNAANWCGGVPTSSTAVTIAGGVANNPTISTNVSVGSMTINSGATLTMSGTPNLTVAGNFANTGTFVSGTSTVTFSTSATISGTVAFHNLTANAAVNPGTETTINGTLQINGGGSVITNSPAFGSSSTLAYNFGGGFGSRRNQSVEWPATNGPTNLTLTNGSWIQLTGNRSLAGNATMTNGALQASGQRSLTMNGSSQTITVSNTSGGAIFGTDNGINNDLSLVIASGSTTTLTGDATTSNDDEKKFFTVTVDAGGTLVLARGILAKYGTFNVNGTLQLNNNGYVQSTGGSSPIYGASATLVYNSGTTYGRSTEWTSTSGAGYPTNVTISNNTTLNLANAPVVDRAISGSLTIDNGSALTMGSMPNKLTVRDVSISGTLTLSSAIGGDLWINRNFTRTSTGVFNPGAGAGRAVFFKGSANGTITADQGQRFPYLFIDKDAQANTISLADSIMVDSTLGMVRGTLDLQNADVVLRSNAGGTVRVSEMNPANVAFSYSGTGRFVHERYVPTPARRAWRLFTAPLSNSNSVFDSWQNGGVYAFQKGTHITSPGATGPNGNGLDPSATNGTSFRLWNPTTQAYFNLTNTKTANISSGTGTSAANTGYFVFVRGDRTPSFVDFGSAGASPTTLVSRGQIQFGTQTFTSIAPNAGQFTLVGNPYAAPVDWDAVLANAGNARIQRKIYTWDSRMNTVGGYVVLDDVDTPGDFEADPNTSSQTQVLQSGQAFFVITDAGTGSPSLVFQESNKSTFSFNPFMRPVTASSAKPLFRANLFLLNPTDNSLQAADGATARFDASYCACVDGQDNIKLTNVNETFGFVRNNTFLATERRQQPGLSSGDTLYLRLTRSSERSYQFQFMAQQMPLGIAAKLIDSYTGAETPLSLTDTNRINFVINADAASKNQDRFRVVFGPLGGPLPVTFTNIAARQQNRDIAVNWSVENQVNIRSYQVERAADGRNFSQVHQTAAVGANGTSNTYSFLDVNPANGDHFYRVRSIGVDGQQQVSRVVKVTIGTGKTGITVYPNPVRDGVVGVQLNNLPAGTYQVRLMNMSGQQVLSQVLNHDGGSATEQLRPASVMAKGIYQLEILATTGGQRLTSQVVVE